MEKLKIIHTNDLHSHLEHWPQIRNLILKRREELKKTGAEVLVMDMGDFSDRVHPLTEATKGQANTTLMNQIDYDGVTIGNNEGLGNSYQDLNKLYTEANFPVIVSNLFDLKTQATPPWAQRDRIVTTKKGTRIGLIALTVPYQLTYEPNGWLVKMPEEVLPELLAELEPKVDSIVLLSHLGIQVDLTIAQRYPSIDLILGSHTHHLLPEGHFENETLLAAAGKYGQYVGEVSLEFSDHHLKTAEAKVYKIEEAEATQGERQETQNYQELGRRLLAQQVVAKLPHGLYRRATSQEESLSETILSSLLTYAGVSSALVNTGLILDDLPEGTVSQDQLHQLLPHPMHIIKVKMQGKDLRELIKEIENSRGKLLNAPVAGMGFRGKVFGEIVYRGITVYQMGEQIFWQDDLLGDERVYTFATVDYLLFSPLFPRIKQQGEVEFLFPEFIREVVGQYLSQKFPIKQ